MDWKKLVIKDQGCYRKKSLTKEWKLFLFSLNLSSWMELKSAPAQ